MKLAILALCPGLCFAAVDPRIPYIPTSDDVVLEQINRESRAGGDLRQLQQELSQRPTDLAAAAKFARIAIERGTEEADPRFFGYAQSALSPWWRESKPPAEARLLRATILQWQHQFDRAIQDLDAVIAADGKGTEQAHLTRASLELVRGDPEASRRDCVALIGRAETLITATCIAAANAALGHAVTTEQSLKLAIEQTGGSSDAALVWANTELAEIGLQLGDREVANRAFTDALAAMRRSQHRDPYLLAAYADDLLEREQFDDVVALLSDLTRIDNLLLRLTLAEAQLGDRGDARMAERGHAHTADLQRRFAETRQRGDFVHQREEALLLLKLTHDGAAALVAARDNWSQQKELIDARILLEAAQAAGTPQAADSVRTWIERYHVEDRRLKPSSGLRQGT